MRSANPSTQRDDMPCIVPSRQVSTQVLIKALHSGGAGSLDYKSAAELVQALHQVQPEVLVKLEGDVDEEGSLQ